MKRVNVGIFVLLMILLPTAVADTEGQKEAEKLLNTMGMDSAMTESMSVMIDLQLKQNPALAPFKTVMMEFFSKYMSWESLKPEFLKIYSETFSASELREINAFYATDTGKKTIREMPALMARGGQIGAARVQENIGELQSMIEIEAERIDNLQ